MQARTAQRWVERWDRQQEHYLRDREQRFQVVGDVVAWAAARAGVVAPAVVDLGCGPGSLGQRLVERLPGARVVGVDSHPLLLELARGVIDGERMRVVAGDLVDPSWPDAVDLPRPWDAAVSSTALHWLDADGLAVLYGILAEHLRPGGVFVDADHRRPASPAAADLVAAIGDASGARRSPGDEDWSGWWDAILADPDATAGLVDPTRGGSHHDSHRLSTERQAEMLRAAGFAEVTTVWQDGDESVLVGIR